MAKQRYTVVTEALLERIAAGQWKVGDTLPTENALSALFEVSRSTVRLALQRLENWGMVSRRRRRGTVLTAAEPRHHYQQQIGGLEQLDDFGQRTELHLTGLNVVAGPDITRAYDLSETLQGRWIEYTGWRNWLDSPDPISWTRVAFDGIYEGISEQIGRERKPTYRIIEETFDLKVVAIEQEVRACTVTAEIASGIGSQVGDPALEVIRLMFEQSGKPLLLAHSFHRADIFSLKMRFGLQGFTASP